MISSLIAGLVFGLSAGVAPGPLLTYVVTQTLRYGPLEGIKVALAPLVTDLPIILVSLFILTRFSASGTILGSISLIGGGYVLYLAWESIRIGPVELTDTGEPPNSLLKGAVLNALNPHPYLFWMTVGGPFILKGGRSDLPEGLWFILGFYVLLVGSKVGIAIVVGKSRSFLKSRAYLWTLRVLGAVLGGFGAFLIYDALKLFGIVGVYG